MKIIPGKVEPQQAAQQHRQDYQKQQDLRAKAISTYMGGQAPTQPTDAADMQAHVAPQASDTEHISEVAELAQEAASNVPEIETPVVENNEEPKIHPEETLSSQQLMLARRERAFRQKVQQQEQSWKQKEDAHKQKEQEWQTKEQKYQSGYFSVDDLKANPLKVFAQAGVSYDEVTNAILNQGQVDPRTEAYIQRLEAKLAGLEEKTTGWEKRQQESQTEQYNAALKQIKTDVSKLVRVDTSFEMIKATNSVDDVVDLIKRTFDEEGVILSTEEAAQEVEEYLVEEASRLARLSKVQKRTAPAPSKPAAPVQAVQQPPKVQSQPQPVKNLTNQISSTRKLSSRERAMLAFKNELKS